MDQRVVEVHNQLKTSLMRVQCPTPLINRQVARLLLSLLRILLIIHQWVTTQILLTITSCELKPELNLPARIIQLARKNGKIPSQNRKKKKHTRLSLLIIVKKIFLIIQVYSLNKKSVFPIENISRHQPINLILCEQKIGY